MDTAFGNNGVVSLDSIQHGFTAPKDILVLIDSKIIVGGVIPHESAFALIRLDSSGAPDPGFGTGGVVETSVGPGNIELDRLLLDLSQRVIAAGPTDQGLLLARYLPDGSADRDFNVGGARPGTVLVRPNGATSFSYDFADRQYDASLQPDGKILFVGVNHSGPSAITSSLFRIWP